MKLSKRLRKWKANLTTQTPIEYVITLRADVNGFADEVKALERENAKLRELILDMLVDEARGHNDDNTYYEHVRLAKELGIEVHE